MCYLEIDRYRISTPLIDIITDIKNNLTNGKLKVVKVMGKNIRVTCPHHNEGLENTAAADIYIGDKDNKIAYGWFKCFVCGEQGPFYHFVAECFDISDDRAKEWLVDNYADSLTEYQIEIPELNLQKNENTYLNESVLDNLEDFHPYMTKRRLTKEVVDKFQIKYEPSSKCLVFPVRDFYGKLLMLTRRSVENKTFIIDKDKIKPVYLLYYLKEKNIQTAFICESQINALTCHSYHLPGVALFGTGSSHQYDILNKSSIRYYVLCFDGDSAGQKGIREFLKNIRKDVIVDVVKMPLGKDVNDLSKEEFFKVLKKNFIDVDDLVKMYEDKISES